MNKSDEVKIQIKTAQDSLGADQAKQVIKEIQQEAESAGSKGKAGMDKFRESTKGLTTAMKALRSVMVGFGAIGFVKMLGDGVRKLDEMVSAKKRLSEQMQSQNDANAAQRLLDIYGKINEELKKANDELAHTNSLEDRRLENARKLEDAQMRLGEEREVDALNASDPDRAEKERAIRARYATKRGGLSGGRAEDDIERGARRKEEVAAADEKAIVELKEHIKELTESFKSETGKAERAQSQAGDRWSYLRGTSKTYQDIGAGHSGRLVFSGRVYSRGHDYSRGSTAVRQYTARGPWQTLDDLIYRQQWQALGVSGPAAQFFSRVILNQAMSGAPVLLGAQILDILAQAATASGAFAVGTVSVPAVYLPADEQRSVTLAQALMRCLRLFPSVAAWFDYSGSVPVLNIGEGAGAAWLDDPELRATVISEEQAGASPDGVVLEVETTGEWNGSAYRKVDLQAAGDVADGRKVLYIPLELQGAGGSVTSSSLDVETEDIPPDWQTNKQWWKSKHPRLANVDAEYMTVKDARRTGTLPRIAAIPMKDIENAGLRAELSTFSVLATIPTLDDTNSEVDVERDVFLTMDFITTNAQTRKYTWVDSRSATSGEWIPDGLAEAVLAQHASDGAEMSVVARPDASFWVVPGQSRGGLPRRLPYGAQSVPPWDDYGADGWEYGEI